MKRISLLLLFLILLFPYQLLAQEGPKLIVGQDVLKFSCRPVCEPSQQFSFRLYSQGGEVGKLQITKEIKNPEGMSLSSEALSVEKEKDTVSGEGINITLKIRNDDFLRPGDYTVALLFKGEGPSNKFVELPKSLTINRPAAAINQDELKDCTIQLTRPFFWCYQASGECTFRLYDKDNKATISNLTVAGQNVFQANSKILVPGKVKAVIAEEDKGKSQCLPAPEQLPVTLTFSGLEQTGDFTTGILVQSPSFSSPYSIPLKLQITDWGLWPFLAIFLGVAGGFGTRYLAKQYKPRQENLYQIIKFRGTLERWRATATKPKKLKTLEGLSRQLLAAEEKNNFGDTAGARTLLTQLEGLIGTYRQEEDNDFIRITSDYNKLKAQLDRLIEQVLDPGKKNKLQDMLAELKGVERQLPEEVDRADELLANSQGKFKSFLTEELTSMESEINDNPDNLGELKPKIQPIRDALENNRLEEAVTKLIELTRKLREIKPGILSLYEPEAPEELRVYIEYQPESCVSGGKLYFNLENLDMKKLPADSRVEWVFGDGVTKTQEVDIDQVKHTYETSEKYLVEATLVIKNQTTKAYSRWVTVLPGRMETLQGGTREKLRRANWTISLVALLLATLSGLMFLYIGKPFGSLQDYLKAILWGFGVDTGVYGFAEVLKKVSE